MNDQTESVEATDPSELAPVADVPEENTQTDTDADLGDTTEAEPEDVEETEKVCSMKKTRAKDLICYDEVAQLLETQVRYSMTWNRPTKDHISQL
jgi:hypothetical protein